MKRPIESADSGRLLRKRIQRGERAKRRAPSVRDELLAIGRRCAALPDLDSRIADEILRYDESGVPR